MLSPAMAQAKDFEVDFEYDPLFSEANFLPGDSVIRYIRVKNNSTGIFKIATKADKWINNDALGDNAIANNLRQQAAKMSAEAKGLLVESENSTTNKLLNQLTCLYFI